MIHVLTVEDQLLVARGIQRILDAASDIEVVRTVQDPDQVIGTVAELRPDVVLLDIDLGTASGFDLIAPILERAPQTKIVILSMYVNLEYVLRAHAEGAQGYVLKNDDEQELIDAIRTVHGGTSTCSPGVARLAASLGVSFGDREQMLAKLLSPREREVVRQVALGTTVGEIATKLSIRVPTVRTLWSRAQRKLGIRAVPLPKYVLRDIGGEEHQADEGVDEGTDEHPDDLALDER